MQSRFKIGDLVIGTLKIHPLYGEYYLWAGQMMTITSMREDIHKRISLASHDYRLIPASKVCYQEDCVLAPPLAKILWSKELQASRENV